MYIDSVTLCGGNFELDAYHEQLVEDCDIHTVLVTRDSAEDTVEDAADVFPDTSIHPTDKLRRRHELMRYPRPIDFAPQREEADDVSDHCDDDEPTPLSLSWCEHSTESKGAPRLMDIVKEEETNKREQSEFVTVPSRSSRARKGR